MHRLQAVAAGTWGALPPLPVPLGETAAGILINPKNGANWLVVVGEGEFKLRPAMFVWPGAHRSAPRSLICGGPLAFHHLCHSHSCCCCS